MRFLLYLWQWTWGFMQTLIGLIFKLRLSHCKSERFRGSIVTYHDGDWGGISLGMFIFVNGTRGEEWLNTTRVHEYGHFVQSLILGPFYLFIIGLPSLIWCNSKKSIKLREEKGIKYSSFYCEKWANYLGTKVCHAPSIDR